MLFTPVLQFQLFSSHVRCHLELYKADHGSDPISGLFLFIVDSRKY